MGGWRSKSKRERGREGGGPSHTTHINPSTSPTHPPTHPLPHSPTQAATKRACSVRRRHPRPKRQPRSGRARALYPKADRSPKRCHPHPYWPIQSCPKTRSNGTKARAQIHARSLLGGERQRSVTPPTHPPTHPSPCSVNRPTHPPTNPHNPPPHHTNSFNHPPTYPRYLSHRRRTHQCQRRLVYARATWRTPRHSQQVGDSPTHPPTHLPTQPPTHPTAHPAIHSFTHPSTHPPTRPPSEQDHDKGEDLVLLYFGIALD